METDTDRAKKALAHSRSPSPPIPPNTLEPEKEFIITFESIAELWDTTNPYYSNKYKRNENLAKLLPILKKIKPNATLEDVKKKINTLRSNYRREIKKVLSSKRSGAGAEEIYVPKIWYYPYLHFLSKLEQPVPLPIQQESESTHQTQQSTPESKTQQSKENTQERTFSSIVAVPKPSVSSTKTKKKASREELLDRACQYLSEPCTQKNQNDNLSSPIALEWSNTLDRLDPVQRLYAKKGINDILFEAELGNLNRYSIRINDSSCDPPRTYTETQNYSPHPHSFSPNNYTSTSPLPPQLPASQRRFTYPNDLPSDSPQQTAPLTDTPPQNFSPYPHSSSPNNSTLTSPPPPPSPASQQTFTYANALASDSHQQTASLTDTPTQNYSQYLYSSSQNNSTSTSPPPIPSIASQQTIKYLTVLPLHSLQQTAPVTSSKTITKKYRSRSTISQSSTIRMGLASQLRITNPNFQQQTSYILPTTPPQQLRDDSQSTNDSVEYTASTLFSQFEP